MRAVATARSCHRIVARVAPFKVVRRDATGAIQRMAVADATGCDATCDMRHPAMEVLRPAPMRKCSGIPFGPMGMLLELLAAKKESVPQ